MEAERAAWLENILMYRDGDVGTPSSPRMGSPALRTLLDLATTCRSLPLAIHLYNFLKQLIFIMLFCHFIYLFLERGKGREKKGEKY